MNIAVLSDSHDHWENMKKAVEIVNTEGCDVLLHAGDLIAPPGIDVLKVFNGKVFYVWGNNEGEKVGISHAIETSENITLDENEMDREIGGLKVYMNHYPHISRMAFESGKYDLSIYGHDHKYNVESSDGKTLLNPGEICGARTGSASFAIFDVETKSVRKVEL